MTITTQAGDLLTPEEAAAMWGNGGASDRWPNRLGDGALFYNFGSAGWGRTLDNLLEFHAAIIRTIAACYTGGFPFPEVDEHELRQIAEHVMDLIREEAKRAAR